MRRHMYIIAHYFYDCRDDYLSDDLDFENCEQVTTFFSEGVFNSQRDAYNKAIELANNDLLEFGTKDVSRCEFLPDHVAFYYDKSDEDASISVYAIKELEVR